MNAKRLLKLADFLDKLPRAKFDFGVIAMQDGKPMLEALKAGKERCGTVACAIGWMPAVFPRSLRWTERPEVERGRHRQRRTDGAQVCKVGFHSCPL